MAITACVIQGKNEFSCVLNFKGFHLTKRKKKEHKEGDKSTNSGLKRRINSDYFSVLYNPKLLEKHKAFLILNDSFERKMKMLACFTMCRWTSVKLSVMIAHGNKTKISQIQMPSQDC